MKYLKSGEIYYSDDERMSSYSWYIKSSREQNLSLASVTAFAKEASLPLINANCQTENEDKDMEQILQTHETI